jgi:uncharacterized DUF497 family protein
MDLSELISRCTGFQWDEGNLSKVWERHRVTPNECEQVFINEPLYAALNGEHSSAAEQRYTVFGQTNAGRALTVVFTIRGESIRVISARDMNRRERKAYAT